MIDKNLIFTDLRATTKEEVIEKLADRMLSSGKVKATYKNAVIEREKVYPTGIALGSFSIAMPHTFAEHVLQPAIAVAKLDCPVQFVEMGTKDTVLDVSLVLMMAISNPQEQVGMLKKILRLFADENILARIAGSTTPDELYETLRYVDE